MAHIQSIPISSNTKETVRTEQLTVRVMRLWYRKSETKPNDVPTDVVERLVRDLCAEYGEAFSEVILSVNRIEQSPGSCVFNASYSHAESSRTQQNTYVPLNNDGDPSRFNDELIRLLENMIDSHNTIAKTFRKVRDTLIVNTDSEVSIKLISRKSSDGRTYNLPTVSEVAALIEGDIGPHMEKRDIIVRRSCGGLQRISELHPLYTPLQCPLLIPSGEDGYRPGILHSASSIGVSTSDQPREETTCREWFAYHIIERPPDIEFPTILLSGKAFHQFLVDCYMLVESHRLNFIRFNQDLLRVDNYKNLSNAVGRGDVEPSSAGTRFIVPSSFPEGDKWKKANFLDTMTICKWFGYPDLFITFTCNPKWLEIVRFVSKRGLRLEDRPDIVCRIFKMKLDELIKDLKDRHIFGRARGVVYTIEFQKRGLPHAHIVLFLHREDKFPTAADVDKIISAEIPDPTKDPVLQSVVCEYMLHGSCGKAKPSSPCMVGDKCSKYYPKPCTERITIDGDGYPIYKRRKKGFTVIKVDVPLGNDFVIPYNSQLLLKYRAHINVEWSAWRIFGFDIHYRTPAIERLQYHLPDEQPIVFHNDDWVDEVVENTSLGVSQFLNWMGCNNSTVEEMQVAKELLYCEFPTKFVWKNKVRQWSLRKKGFTIGRLVYVPSQCDELYFMRVLLNHVKGPKYFEDIRTLNDFVHPTFREACYALGLIGADREYIVAINEAADWGSGFYLRNLFATLLFCVTLSMSSRVWDETWQLLSDDILHRQRTVLNNQDNIATFLTTYLQLTDEELQNYALIDIESCLQINGSSLRRFEGMSFPDMSATTHHRNSLVMDALSYDRQSLSEEHEIQLSSMSDEQRLVINEVMEAALNNKGGVFFVYGYGETGKTFLWRALSACFRSKDDIVVAVVSSGIAATLISGGVTAHSRFGISINVTEDSICSRIKPDSDLAELLIRAKLIIRNEAPMTHRHCFEALDKSLKDVMHVLDMGNAELPFGGKVVVFGGDFRQTLPVVSKGSRADVVAASLSSDNVEELRKFSEWLLEIGDGIVGGENEGEVDLELPTDLLIQDVTNPIKTLVDVTYPDLLAQLWNPEYLQQRAILAPTHEIVESVNEYVLSLIKKDERIYLSSDEVCSDDRGTSDGDIHSTEFLNIIKCAGLPNHQLRFKVAAMVMLL
ncbi:uncharacterized protein LOC141619874 [Silene latifolia]|uniref:uncharacterized protein LOC141619874 n=1 Tax=Silene latifolia TaxID=37657 RepID=UPI003D770CE9